MVTTKISQLKAFLDEGNHRKAIRLAASFWDLADSSKAIQQAASALTSPDMYRQMGMDPDALVAEGIRVIKERYGWDD